MVGIVLASHGNFAEGIYQSAEMIFGKQQNVQTVTLSPNEGPEDFLNKLKQAIDSFDDQKQVLLLIDLWGGTPFNQSSGLLSGHEDSWAVVTGMNLPMVIEAYGSRSSMDSAQEIATHIIETGKDGIRIKPESLEPKRQRQLLNPVVNHMAQLHPELFLEMAKLNMFWLEWIHDSYMDR